MNNRLCYLSHNYRNLTSSGNKAKSDNERTLVEMGACNLGLHQTVHSGKIASFVLNLAGILRMLKEVRRGDVIVLQYPLKKYFSLVCRAAHYRGAKVVALIHDLGSMRRKKLTVRHEISRLSNADYIIASNDTMAEWLRENGMQRPLGGLGLFDFRSPSSVPIPQLLKGEGKPSGDIRVVYAGALSERKNSFLCELPDTLQGYVLEIYGDSTHLPRLRETSHVRLHPFMPADRLIESRVGHFGLVWDGESLSECRGDFGDYLRWNSPHKASLYLRAGMPIVVWKRSALAPVVEQLGIGLCIETLYELETVILSMSADTYNSMAENVCRTAEKLNNGGFFSDALHQALDVLAAEEKQ